MAHPRLQSVPILSICVDADTQSREGVTATLVDEYAEAWLNGAEFPPLDVFQDKDGQFYLADGFHRLMAARKVGKSMVACRIFRGGPRSAFLFACTTNQTHGLRRTNADKRYMVGRFLSDPEWVKWTDSRIAEQCGVSHTFVTSVRRELESVANSAASIAKDLPRRGSDGKSYPSERKTTRESAGHPPAPRRNEISSRDLNRSRVISSLKLVKRLLTDLGLDPRHITALEAIEDELLSM